MLHSVQHDKGLCAALPFAACDMLTGINNFIEIKPRHKLRVYSWSGTLYADFNEAAHVLTIFKGIMNADVHWQYYIMRESGFTVRPVSDK